MAANKLSAKDKRLIQTLVNIYEGQQELVDQMLGQLRGCITGSSCLMRHVHSLRWRVKDPEHLRDKLSRKFLEAKVSGLPFGINKDNLLLKINDLAGIRILHLHTSQIVDIDRELSNVFDEFRFKVIERAKARTWDDEYREYYNSVGIKTVVSPKMYTSVHYVVAPNIRTKVTCEIQVRTLAEELWGEVDHSMNYPVACSVDTCREQIKVLARVTSSCSRLVDSIYRARKGDGAN